MKEEWPHNPRWEMLDKEWVFPIKSVGFYERKIYHIPCRFSAEIRTPDPGEVIDGKCRECNKELPVIVALYISTRRL